MRSAEAAMTRLKSAYGIGPRPPYRGHLRVFNQLGRTVIVDILVSVHLFRGKTFRNHGLELWRHMKAPNSVDNGPLVGDSSTARGSILHQSGLHSEVKAAVGPRPCLMHRR